MELISSEQVAKRVDRIGRVFDPNDAAGQVRLERLKDLEKRYKKAAVRLTFAEQDEFKAFLEWMMEKIADLQYKRANTKMTNEQTAESWLRQDIWEEVLGYWSNPAKIAANALAQLESEEQLFKNLYK